MMAARHPQAADVATLEEFNELPPGVLTHAHQVLAEWTLHVPSHGERVQVTFILASGAIGDYAAYVGSGEPEWVLQQGVKLGFDEAARLFPGVVRGRYRG